MLNKKITFCASNGSMVDIWPHPKPASRVIPEEYKDLKRFRDNDLHQPTVKTCMPFLDSMTMGYVMFFEQDYLVDPIEGDFSVTPANREQNDFGYHSQAQLPEKWHTTTGKNAGKFHNKWLIKTPPGYSCLFLQPMNRLEKRFKIIEGVVDTDRYTSLINFPFILLKKDKQFLLKKGEPMIQVIRFKRESYKMWSGFYYEKAHNKVLNLMQSKWLDKYKSYFWNKKNYK